MRNNKAFTLAEILITIGIIGVVSALTIPSLLSNIKAHQYRQKLKKTVSTLSNAARLSQAQYGFDYAGINAKCGANGGNEKPESVQTICSLLNGTLTGVTYYDKASEIQMTKVNSILNYSTTLSYSAILTSGSGNNLDRFHSYVLSNGIIIAFPNVLGIDNPCSLPVGETLGENYSGGSLNDCYGFIDVNGVNLPNKEVSCSSGKNLLSENTCIVKNDSEHMTDIYPIRFHDSVVEPASAAARYVLRTAK
ncbi:type II secretion system protein [bacterium]|nr:type II secretion system protein [bacterium]